MSPSGQPKTLVFSCRAQNYNLAAASFYEFEDLIRDWMDADLLAPSNLPFNVRRKVLTAVYKATCSKTLSRTLASPRFGSLSIKEHYDLIFALVPNMSSTYKLFDFRNLRRQTDVLVAYVPEVWAKGLKQNPYLAEPLRDCDHIFVSTQHSVDVMSEVTGRPCSFLNFGVDVVKFCPYPHYPDRAIDVLNIGRRSQVTHEALVRHAGVSNFYYVYDTVASSKTINGPEHRAYFANTAKRSKFFIANTANFDQPERTGGALEIGHRYYEAAAAGSVIVGSYPEDHPVIRSDFDWQDAVVQAPYDAPNIVDLIQDIQSIPARMDAIHRANVWNTARRHDFVYRWASILEKFGYPQTQSMLDRQTTLDAIARAAQSAAPQSSSEAVTQAAALQSGEVQTDGIQTGGIRTGGVRSASAQASEQPGPDVQINPDLLASVNVDRNAKPCTCKKAAPDRETHTPGRILASAV